MTYQQTLLESDTSAMPKRCWRRIAGTTSSPERLAMSDPPRVDQAEYGVRASAADRRLTQTTHLRNVMPMGERGACRLVAAERKMARYRSGREGGRAAGSVRATSPTSLAGSGIDGCLFAKEMESRPASVASTVSTARKADSSQAQGTAQSDRDTRAELRCPLHDPGGLHCRAHFACSGGTLRTGLLNEMGAD